MGRKKLLITGFDPFGGGLVNPAWEAVSRLPDRVGEYDVTKLRVPTVFGRAAETVLEAARWLRPGVILCVGQAGGRSGVTPEMVAVNLRYASIQDNTGSLPQDVPVVEGGPAAYFATVPVRAMAQAVQERGISGTVSYSAGTFVCNDLMYTLLHTFAGSGVRVGFVHVPFLPEQAGEGVPSMPLETIVQALEAAVRVL